MNDNKNIRDNRDSAKIDLNDASEVAYVQQQFPRLNREQVLELLKPKGRRGKQC